VSRPKADPTDSSQVGAPMSGVLVEVRVHDGSEVKKGDPVAILSAMKMVCIMQVDDMEEDESANVCGRKWSSRHLTQVRLVTCLCARAILSTLATLFASLSSRLGKGGKCDTKGVRNTCKDWAPMMNCFLAQRMNELFLILILIMIMILI
jgi:hypothetical protein